MEVNYHYLSQPWIDREESSLLAALDRLRRDYEREAAPIIRRLVELQSLKTPVVTVTNLDD